jgi:hypothetical protein
MNKELEILSVENYFTSSIYWIEKKEFIPTTFEVAREYLNIQRESQPLNKIYPVHMTGAMENDARLYDLVLYIASTSWNILNEQGFNMDLYEVFVQELWAQEHHTTSSMDQHVHGLGSQISGFYVLDGPENSSKIVVCDPRPGKNQINLLERDPGNLTYASQKVLFNPTPGNLYFTNSWLPHEFTRNTSNTPFTFLHFNVGARYKTQLPINNIQNNVIPVEII